MRSIHTALGLCVCLLPAPAQEPPPARAFLLDDFKNVAFADLAALRQRGIWDDLEVSVLKVAFTEMQKELGFPLAAIDRVTMVAEFGATTGGEEAMARSVRDVLTFEGNRTLALPASVGKWTRATVGPYTVHRRDQFVAEMVVQPRPELLVRGTTAVIEPVLAGTPHSGLPAPDVLSLLSGRGDNLAYIVFDVDHALTRRIVLGTLFPGAAWPEDDGPSFVFCRVRAIGDAADPHLEVEAVLRHKRAGEGLDMSDRVIAAWLERMKEEPAMRAVLPVFERLEKRRDRTDLCLRADLGRTREAIGHLATLAAPILLRAAPIEEVHVKEPAPPPRKQAP